MIYKQVKALLRSERIAGKQMHWRSDSTEMLCKR